jgi:hypothetical protein
MVTKKTFFQERRIVCKWEAMPSAEPSIDLLCGPLNSTIALPIPRFIRNLRKLLEIQKRTLLCQPT